jgi:hypothetical protein
MPDTPATPAPDSLAAEALRRGKRLRRRRLLVHRGATSAALLGVVALAVVLKVAASPSPHASPASPGTGAPTPQSTTTSAAAPSSTTLSPTTTTAPTTTTTSPTTSTTSTTAVTTTTVAPSGTTSGTVTGPDGQPVGGASVIGLDNLVVAVTDANGDYSMPCVPQPLVAASWLIPVYTPSPGTSGGYSYGTDSTSYGAPPTSPEPGYVFSGGASDISAAATVACDGQPVDFQLPQGGAVDITWKNITYSESAQGTTPIDNLYLPGLGRQAALETAPLSSDGQQVIDGVGPGTLQIDGVSTPFTCTGPGTTADGQAIYSVTVTAGQTTFVTCTIPTASS